MLCNIRITYSENIVSFVNNVKTIDGGTHEVGFKTALTKVFNDYAIVKSNNNNTSVSLENLYFTDQIGRESEGKFYHKN